MLTYVYSCDDCKRLYDVPQKVADLDKDVIACGKCGKKMHRKLQPVATIFRGGGWPGEEIRTGSTGTILTDQEEHYVLDNLPGVSDKHVSADDLPDNVLANLAAQGIDPLGS